MGIVAPDIVHPTTVHSLFDNRIFHRERKTLAADGYDVVLMAPGGDDGPIGGVEFIPRPTAANSTPS